MAATRCRTSIAVQATLATEANPVSRSDSLEVLRGRRMVAPVGFPDDAATVRALDELRHLFILHGAWAVLGDRLLRWRHTRLRFLTGARSPAAVACRARDEHRHLVILHGAFGRGSPCPHMGERQWRACDNHLPPMLGDRLLRHARVAAAAAAWAICRSHSGHGKARATRTGAVDAAQQRGYALILGCHQAAQALQPRDRFDNVAVQPPHRLGLGDNSKATKYDTLYFIIYSILYRKYIVYNTTEYSMLCFI